MVKRLFLGHLVENGGCLHQLTSLHYPAATTGDLMNAEKTQSRLVEGVEGKEKTRVADTCERQRVDEEKKGPRGAAADGQGAGTAWTSATATTSVAPCATTTAARPEGDSRGTWAEVLRHRVVAGVLTTGGALAGWQSGKARRRDRDGRGIRRPP